MDTKFSIWWVISIGCLLLFVLSALLKQRKQLFLELGATTVPLDTYTPTRVLRGLETLAPNPDARSMVSSFGASPLDVHDIRYLDVKQGCRIAHVPVAVQRQLEDSYAKGKAYGPELVGFLRGEPLAKNQKLYFALLVKQGKDDVIAFVH